MIVAPDRTDNAKKFRRMMEAAGLSNEAAADMCCVSIHTVISWMKSASSVSHNRCPEWAVELLRLKIDEAARNAALPEETAAWMSEQ